MTASTPSSSLRLHDRYNITARLGQSRLALVYRAQDERLQRPVLVHLLRPELMSQAVLRQRFLEEARRGARRSHPGLLEVYDSGEVSDRPYMVTEDISGVALAERVPLPLAEALSLLRTVASAVALSQSQAAPHPPISSRNVWLLAGGRPVLLENWQLTPREAALDLAHYRAPERAAGGPPSPATSVYALGILSWETIAGRRPFTGPTLEAIVQRQTREPLPLLGDVNSRLFVPGLDRVIQGAAAPDPSRRYPAPVDFSRALDLYADQVTAHTGRLAILPQPQPAPDTGKLRVLRRGGTAAPTVAPPPPPPVIREQPHIARRAVVAPPVQSAPPPPQVQPAPLPPRPQPVAQPAPLDQQQVGQAVQKAVRREMRRQGCRRAIVKRSIQLVLILALIYAALVGVDYATGRLQQLNPAAWIGGRLPQVPSLPDLSWINRLIGLGKDIRGAATGSTLIVTQPVNLRPGPSTQGAALRQLGVGTVIRRISEPVDDQTGLPLKWIKVIVLPDGTQGWVAYQPDRLREQNSTGQSP